jgi:predicted phage terminase large subunit-like protein
MSSILPVADKVPTFEGIPLFMLPADVHAAVEAMHKLELAGEHLEHYARVVLEVEPALHHRVICRYIDDLLADDYDELIIVAPPGSAKSTYTSHALAAYYLGRWPDKNIIIATHTSDLSERWSRKVRNTFASPEHIKVFPKARLSKDSTAVGRWATSEGGELLAAGVGGAVLGFRADLVTIDDPLSGFEQAQSETQLTKVHNWYETDLATRMKPGAKLVLICQRLARNDLAGYLIDRNIKNPTKRQRILKLPMLAVEGVVDPVGRAPGERLWPEWYTPEMVADAQRDDYKWRTLYQQEPPSDTGSWVSTNEIKFAPTPQTGEEYSYYGLTDLALSVGKGDYTVHIIVAHHRSTGQCHIVDFYRARVDPAVSATKLVDLATVYKPVEWLIDDDNASKVFMQLVATEAQSRRAMVNWKPLPMRGQDKETRAAPLRGMFKRGVIYLDPSKSWTNIIVNELLQFPNALGAGVDDCVDALGLIGRRMTVLQTTTPAAPRPKQPTIQEMTLNDLWKDQKQVRVRI